MQIEEKELLKMSILWINFPYPFLSELKVIVIYSAYVLKQKLYLYLLSLNRCYIWHSFANYIILLCESVVFDWFATGH